MKKVFYLILLVNFFTTCYLASAQQHVYKYAFQNPALSTEERVVDLVSRMTLQEKADQLLYTAPAIPRLGICREVATERDLMNCADTFYELPAENADGFAKIRPVASHSLKESVKFTIEVELIGHGPWMIYKELSVAPGETLEYTFPDNFQSRWIRFQSDKNCAAPAWLEYN